MFVAEMTAEMVSRLQFRATGGKVFEEPFDRKALPV